MNLPTIAILCFICYMIGSIAHNYRTNLELRRRRSAWKTGDPKTDALVEVLTRPIQ